VLRTTERRFLVSFDTASMPQVFCDVLVIGSGVGGLRAALAAAEHGDVLLFAKGRLEESNTSQAQGGIAGALGPGDTVEAHMKDTLAVGQGLCNAEVVRAITAEAPDRIRELIDWGGDFDKENGALALTREGGHSTARIIHALGDATGREVSNTLLRCVRQHDHIQIVENAFALDLVTTDDAGCFGAIVHTQRWGHMTVWAKQTILASGGAGRLYRETTNVTVATGDGVAMAYRAGAELCDMEFYQFHPTALYIAGAARTLISEAVRGEGGLLLNAHEERFMPKYHERAELAPRDTVSRAIVNEIRKSGHTCVYLDVRHIPADRLALRFPGIAKHCAQFDIDLSRDLIPVRPAAHYMVGGVCVTPDGRTTIPNLFVCGEVACTGLHGANRLGSNSLLEGLVTGYHAGHSAGSSAAAEARDIAHPALKTRIGSAKHDAIDVGDITNAIRAVAWRSLGIERTRLGIEEALHMMSFWGRYVMDKEFDYPAGWELQNMLVTARLIGEAALRREESRGVHFRTDFPEKDDENWRVHVICRKNVAPRIRPINEPSEDK